MYLTSTSTATCCQLLYSYMYTASLSGQYTYIPLATSAVSLKTTATRLQTIMQKSDTNKYKKLFPKNVKRCRDGCAKNHSN